MASVLKFLQIAVERAVAHLAAGAEGVLAARERQRVAEGVGRLRVEHPRPAAGPAEHERAADVLGADLDLRQVRHAARANGF